MSKKRSVDLNIRSASDKNKPSPRPIQPWWIRRIRYLWKRFLRLPGSEHKIARGIAVGIFAGMFPFFGFQSIIGVILAILVRGNKFAALAATWISNPLTYVPIFAANLQIGSWLIRGEEFPLEDLNFTSTTELLSLGAVFMRTLLLGCLVTGTIVSFCSYFIFVRVLRKFRHRD